MEEIEFGSWKPSRGAPATLDEVYSASLDAQRKYQNVNSYTRNLMDAYDRVNDEIKKTVGADLINPFNRYRAYPGDAMGGAPPSVYDAEKATPDPIKSWESDLDALAEKHPGVVDWGGLKARPLNEVGRVMKASEEKNSDVMQRRGFVDGKDIPGLGRVPLVRDVASGVVNIAKDPAGMAYSVLGSLRGALESPADIIANLGGLNGMATKSLVKNAVRNGLSNAGIQAVLEPVVQANRAAGGLEYGWEKAFEDLAGAFGTGAALDLAMRPAGRAAIRRFGNDTPDGTFSRNVPRGGVFTDAPEQLHLPPKPVVRPDISEAVLEKARAGNLEALKEVAVKAGIADHPSVKGALDHAELGGKVDEAAMAKFKELGVDDGEGFRTIAEVIKNPDRYIREPSPVRAASAALAPQEAVALVTENAPQVQALLAGLEPRIARAVGHALEAGLPQILPLVREAVAGLKAGATDAVPSFTAKLGEVERFVDVATIHGSHNLFEAADALRRSPDAVDSNVPLTTDFMHGARALSTLDADAYAIIRSGEMSPAIGAEVANTVPPAQQARVLNDLRKAGAETVADARELIDTLVTRERGDEMPLHAGAKISDPAGPEAKAQTERLAEEHADAIKEAEAPLKERDKLESEVETIRGEIAKLEEKTAIGAEKKSDATKQADAGEFDPFRAIDPETTAKPGDGPTAKEFGELAAKRGDLRDAQARLANANDAIFPPSPDDILFRHIMEHAGLQRVKDLRSAIDDALRLATQILPEGTRVQVTPERMIDPVSGHMLDALSDVATGDIALATYAVNPAARIAHEGLHTLVTRGLVSPQEINLLADAARTAKVFPEDVEAKYRTAYEGRPEVDRLIEEEAAAHYIEARIKRGEPAPQSIVDRVHALIKRVRNALDGYGFKTAEDVRDAILRGDVAKREANDAWGRTQRESTDKGPMFALRDTDSLGYYSKALEAARSLKQSKGTPEQMLAQLKTAGVKEAEIKATKLDELLADPSVRGHSITRDEIVKHLEERRVNLSEVERKRSSNAIQVEEELSKWRENEIEKLSTYDSDRHAEISLKHEDDILKFVRENGVVVDEERFRDDASDLLAEVGVKVETGSIPLWEHAESYTFVTMPDGKTLWLSNQGGHEVYQSYAAAVKSLEDDAKNQAKDSIDEAEHQQRDLIRRELEGEDDTKWSSYSLDPANPTYRETVIHLPEVGVSFDEYLKIRQENGTAYRDPIPSNLAGYRRDYDEGLWRTNGGERSLSARAQDKNFRSGHFPEPNIIGHMMTSTVKDAAGRDVFLIDQIQSDWGQKLRDGGVRDEAKIADIRTQQEISRTKADEIMDGYMRGLANEDRAKNYKPDVVDRFGRMAQEGDQTARTWIELNDRANLLNSELRTAEATASGHPLVNTTDQWTNTTLRRAIRLAVEQDADSIAIPSGDTVLSYNPGGTEGMRGFYDKIVPKNLRNLLQKIDKDSPDPAKTATLATPSKGATGKGFTVFPLTDKVKASVINDGQAMFSLREGGDGARIRAYHWTDQTFERFDASETVEAGFHFDDMNQAVTRSATKSGWPWPLKGRLIPVEIEAGRILDLPEDVTLWTGKHMIDALEKHGIMDAETAARMRSKDFTGQERTRQVRDWLVEQGYDTVRYENRFEGAGPSYMTLGTGNVRHARSGAVLFGLSPEPPKAPLHAEVAMIDRMNMLKDLAMACKG